MLGALAAAALMALALLPASARALPADRGYELVSPAEKHGVDIDLGMVTHSSSSGNRLFFQALGAFADAPLARAENNYIATRGPEGWQTQSIDPPLPLRVGPTSTATYAFTEDLSTGIFMVEDPPVLVPGEPEGNEDLYLRDYDAGSVALVTGRPPAVTDPNAPGPVVEWTSPDLTHVLFDTQGDTVYLPGDPTGSTPVFYYADATTGEVSRVDWIPDDSTADPDDEVRPTGSTSGSWFYRRGAISDDGSRVFFTASEAPDGSGVRFNPREAPSRGAQIYMRLDPATPGARTVRISAPEPGAVDQDPSTTYGAYFRQASSDGSKVFFTSCERLTADSTADESGGSDFFAGCGIAETGSGLGDTKSDLYLYDVESGDLVDLTTADPSGAHVRGFVGASHDGSRAYFVASGNLAPGAAGSAPKLYLWEAGSGITHIATLDPDLDPDFGGDVPGDVRVWRPEPTRIDKESRVTPDGRHVAFSSKAPLEPGFDNAGHSQVYLYDAVTDELACASCVGSGPATADAQLRNHQLGPSTHRPSGRILQRNLLDDGSTVFFETAARLAAEDINDVVDVYGYHAASGEVELISAGDSAHPSQFANASPDGRDVFFKTRQRLLASDTDGLVDIYDARVGGGFPQPAPPPADCGLDCQGEPAPPPAQQELGSGAFAGAGNLDVCGVLGHRRARVHHRAELRGHQARRLVRRARRASDPRARRLMRHALRVHRRTRVLHRHELRLVRRIQLCVSERSE